MDNYSEGWKALKEFEQKFCSVMASEVEMSIREGDSEVVGSELVYNHSYMPIPQYRNGRVRANFEMGDKLHLVHQRLETPGKGRVKWALRSFHSILECEDGRYMPKSRYLKEVKFAVNPTEDGYRFQILKTQGGKTRVYWGYNTIHSGLLQEFVHISLRTAATKLIGQYMDPQRIHAVLQWFSYEQTKYPEYFASDNPASRQSQELQLGGPGWSRILTGKTGAKDILNGIYDPKGIRRIPKNAFGGVGEIRTLDRLAKAVFMTRALRSLDPHTFGEVSSVWPDRPINYKYEGSFEKADKIDWLVNKLPKLISVKNIQECQTPYTYMEDTVRMLKQMPRTLRSACLTEIRRNAARGIEWAHDFVATEHAKVGKENKDINVSALSKFEGTVNDDIACVVPKCTHDLVQWGAEYNICIGSYADEVYNGSTYCMGFQNPQTKTFYGFAQVNPWDGHLLQLLGKHNNHLPDVERLAIERYLVTLGVNVDNYWGKPLVALN